MTDRNAKRWPVIMPVEPPYEVLCWLSGNPLILAASVEQSYRMMWAELREMLKEAAVKRRRR
ncbi:MAG: hypothetical protein A3E01_08475 [Gammaproteobacteria bacterium RIFCSPHIGHO2_12_FULL_63_22]|nr:MAG: hypothetical protein A3E01_08475 [Gammaproteobacteria bacterium RIFCSPHIGHO2_12_FULL_63_22]